MVTGQAVQFESPRAALAALLERVDAVDAEALDWPAAGGRVLAEALTSDRDSPPCNVSAMDGYALRLADLVAQRLRVAGEVAIGQPPPAMPAGAVLRIVTGAPIPAGAELVVKREDVQEHPEEIVLPPSWNDAVAGATKSEPGRARPGRDENIRRQGENLRAGQRVIEAGALITPPVVAAMAAFGYPAVRVRRRVGVGILVTGDELIPAAAGDTPVAYGDDPAPPGQPPSIPPWRIRESNGPALAAMLRQHPWLRLIKRVHAPDVPGEIEEGLAGMLGSCDAVILTGGVSAGQYDFVPGIVRKLGADVIFHKLPIRPGKPVLGAIGPGGQVIFALPGNPVSVLVTARRLVVPALARLAGVAGEMDTPGATVAQSDGRIIPLWWHRLVRLTRPGQAALLTMQGSGDIPAASRSDGFVEVPPGTDAAGAWPYYAWSGTGG